VVYACARGIPHGSKGSSCPNPTNWCWRIIVAVPHDVRRQQSGVLSRSRSIPGLLTLIPPGHAVAYHTGGRVSFTTLHVSRAALGKFLRGGTDLPAQDIFAFRDPFIASCVDSLLREARIPDRWTPRFVGALAEALLLQLLRRSITTEITSIQKSPEARVSEARSIIDSNLTGDLSLERLAEEAGISRAHFARLFRQVVKESPHHYVTSRRLEHTVEVRVKGTLRLWNSSMGKPTTPRPSYWPACVLP
jgi:AraC family transcriptional regulator